MAYTHVTLGGPKIRRKSPTCYTTQSSDRRLMFWRDLQISGEPKNGPKLTIGTPVAWYFTRKPKGNSCHLKGEEGKHPPLPSEPAKGPIISMPLAPERSLQKPQSVRLRFHVNRRSQTCFSASFSAATCTAARPLGLFRDP